VAINPTDPRSMLTGGGDDRAFLWHASSLPGPAPPAEGERVLARAWLSVCVCVCVYAMGSYGWKKIKLTLIHHPSVINRTECVTKCVGGAGLPPVRELDDHGDSVSAVGFSCDGTMAATVSWC
jgi:hypothetical protein